MTIDETVPYLARGFIACVGRRDDTPANRIAKDIEYVVVKFMPTANGALTPVPRRRPDGPHCRHRC